MNFGAQEGQTIPVPLVSSIVFLLLKASDTLSTETKERDCDCDKRDAVMVIWYTDIM